MRDYIQKLTGKDVWWGPLTFFMIAALCWFGKYSMEHKQSLDPSSVVVTGLLTLTGTMINFRYGASKKETSAKADHPTEPAKEQDVQ